MAVQMSPFPRTGTSYAQLVDEAGDRVAVRGAAVELGRGPSVQGHPRRPLLGRGPAGLEVGEVLGVDPGAHLDRDRDPAVRRGDRRPDDVAEQPSLPGQRGPAALARHLGHRAAEVQVDVVGAVLVDEQPHRVAHDAGVDAVQLDAARALVRVDRDHREGLRVALEQGPARDHLGDVDAHPGAGVGAEDRSGLLARQAAERAVRDAGHRREHDGHARPLQQLPSGRHRAIVSRRSRSQSQPCSVAIRTASARVRARVLPIAADR